MVPYTPEVLSAQKDVCKLKDMLTGSDNGSWLITGPFI